MNRYTKLSSAAVLVAATLCSTAIAAPYQWQAEFAAPNWTAEAASYAMNADQANTHLSQLLNLQTQGMLGVEQLSSLAQLPDLSPPDRDWVLFKLADSLSDFNRADVSTEAIIWLHGYQSQVRVPDEHAAALGTPLFDVRRAMAATQARWSRQAAVETGLQLVQQPEEFLQLWQSSSPAQRHGLNATAALMHQTDRVALLQALQKRWLAEFSPLAVALVQQPTDLNHSTWVIEHARGAALNSWLQQLPATLPADQARKLLTLASNQGHQAVAIASLGRLAGHDVNARAQLAELLHEPAKSTASAVALASNLDPATLSQTLQAAGITVGHPQWKLVADIQKNRLVVEELQQ